MQRLDWYFINELNNLEAMTLTKCCGTVLSVIKEHNFLSFIISDSTGIVEATLYEDQRVYKHLQLPTRGSSIVVTGHAYRKQLGENNNYILKLKLLLFKIISFEQEVLYTEKTLQRFVFREESSLKENNKVTKTKKPIMKELRAAIEPLDMRNLILCAVYMTLENNPDLNSYTFSASTVQKHRLTKSFLEAKKLREECIDYLLEFINNELNYLVQVKLIEEKEEISGCKIYKINKKFFTELEMRTLGLINEYREKQGIGSSLLVTATNKDLGFMSEKNYAFSENLIHKVLKKFIEEGKIYKTSDKLLYPNY